MLLCDNLPGFPWLTQHNLVEKKGAKIYLQDNVEYVKFQNVSIIIDGDIPDAQMKFYVGVPGANLLGTKCPRPRPDWVMSFDP